MSMHTLDQSVCPGNCISLSVRYPTAAGGLENESHSITSIMRPAGGDDGNNKGPGFL